MPRPRLSDRTGLWETKHINREVMMSTPYTTIYQRIANFAVSMLAEHRKWDASKAIEKATEQSRLFAAYYKTLRPAERAELEALVIARHKQNGRES